MRAHRVQIKWLVGLLAWLVVVGSGLSAVGCRQKASGNAADGGDTIPMRYAQNLLMVRYDDGVLVELKDPWHEGSVLRRYWLGKGHRSGATTIAVPLKRSVVFNTAHASLIGMLGAIEQVAGVADLKYMQLPEIQRRVQQGTVRDCGDGMSPDVERIVEMRADAILLSPFENSGGYGRLEKLGIPLVECADYMETSALGRAEWMRFYGLLYGRGTEADSLFCVVENNYLALKQLVAAKVVDAQRPTVLTERLTGGTWYVPGGRSTMGRLLADAGASYPWADDDHSGSLALSFETVFSLAADADIWLMNHSDQRPLTAAWLSAEHHGYGRLKALQTKCVYYVNSLEVPYFEEVPFRPDYHLRDLILLFHPGLVEGQLRYYRVITD